MVSYEARRSPLPPIRPDLAPAGGLARRSAPIRAAPILRASAPATPRCSATAIRRASPARRSIETAWLQHLRASAAGPLGLTPTSYADRLRRGRGRPMFPARGRAAPAPAGRSSALSSRRRPLSLPGSPGAWNRHAATAAYRQSGRRSARWTSPPARQAHLIGTARRLRWRRCADHHCPAAPARPSPTSPGRSPAPSATCAPGNTQCNSATQEERPDTPTAFGWVWAMINHFTPDIHLGHLVAAVIVVSTVGGGLLAKVI